MRAGEILSSWSTLIRRNITTVRSGNCECCGKYDNNNLMVNCKSFQDDAIPLGQKLFLANDSLMCLSCRNGLSTFRGIHELVKDSGMTSAKFNSLDIFGNDDNFRKYCLKIILQLSNFTKTFEDSIQDLFLVEDKNVPLEFQGTLNIVVDFKYLNVCRYRGRVSKNPDSCNLLTFWETGDTLFPERVARILIFLSTIHSSSRNLNLWIWGAARIFHIDLFCGLPARDIQIKPSKLYRV